MEKKKKTLVINFPALMNGGVENICFNLMSYSVNQGYRVVWFHSVPVLISTAFKKFVCENVEMVVAQRIALGLWKHGDVSFSKEEKVTILSFTPFDMDNALKLTEEFPEVNITPLYVVANTKGRYYYIEEYYWGKIRKWLFKPVRQLMANWVEMDAVRFCAQGQLSVFESHYDCHITSPGSKILKRVFSPPDLDEDQLKQRKKREHFNIVSITRFDFPHKGYVLGLIRAYGRLKEKYPNLYLHIIGYGPGLPQVQKEIANLPAQAQKNIILHGEMNAAQISEVMKDMHLNISVAGSVAVGAKCGVLSIPARNFCEGECEVYGFLPESRQMTTSLEPGELVDSYIERVITMTQEEYVQKCRDSYQVYADVDTNPEYVFEQEIRLDVKPLKKRFLLAVMYMFSSYAYKIGSLLKIK